MSTPDHTPVLPVHVASSDVPMAPAAPARKKIRVIPNTKVLTSDIPVALLIPQSPNREYAIIQALDNPIVVCDSQGQAQSEANEVTGLTGPEGAVIPTGVVVPLKCENALYVTAATFPSRVSVIDAIEQ